ncbi:sel1 repeat family protein [Methylorubrum sp. Q1]|nr:tetratricopeptide repeat protein [Methylorubrum sp. Q1]TFZ56740.1 sel1 repeat family protein [Methylorubrum sp. Q1]
MSMSFAVPLAVQTLAPPVLAEGVAAFQSGAYDRALAVFQPLAEAGDPDAQAWLGALHAGGAGVPASLTQAFEWYRRAAEQGHGPAATNVGAMLAMGQGVAQDRAEGARWLERAAASGDVMAAYNLATLLAKGDGLPADPARAADLYRSAAQAGHYPSQARLGHLYAQGIGVERDRVEAFAWLSLAAGHGVGTALNALEVICKEMSAEEKREGAARAQGRRTEPGRIAPIPA